jgi:mannose-6-phosphate isomerase-like protein (cupin superfamily)
MRQLIITFCLLGLAVPGTAQENGYNEIIVTASRRQANDYDERVPLVGLRRMGDFGVQEVIVAGDSRDTRTRRDEIYAMIKGAIELAGKRGGVELATGEMVVEPLTLTNYKNLSLTNDGRPDSERTSFLIKTKLTSGSNAKAALEQIDAFIKSVRPVGRAEIRASGDLTLSIVRPDQYRAEIVDLVAADAKAVAAKLGGGYGVEIKGIDRPVEWSRASLTDAFLYVPYSYVVVPPGR